MSDARWLIVESDAASAVTHFQMAVQIHRDYDANADSIRRYSAEMAIMHAMQSGHTSLERVLEQVLRMFDEALPDGPRYHADLLRRATQAVGERPPILPPDIASAATETRKFRHRAMHNYEDFDVELAKPAMKAAEVLITGFVAAVARFKQTVDP